MRRYQQRFIEGAVGRGVDRGGRRAGLRPDRRLLGLRLPQVPLGGLRPARLPVDLAAGPLRARVPLRAAERAADGLLPARRPRPRGPAPRPRGAAPRRQLERARLPRRDGRRGAGVGGPAAGPGRARLRQRGRARPTPRPWSPSARAAAPTRTSPTWPARSGASRGALVRLAWAGALDRHRGRSTADLLEDESALTPLARRQAAAALWQAGGACAGGPGRGGRPARAAPRRRPCARPARARARGSGWSPTTARPGSRSATHPMEMLRAELDPAVLTSAAIGRDPRRRAGPGRGDGGRAPAARDREGDRLHAARGRARRDQPDRPPAGGRAPPARGAGPRASSSRAASWSTARARPTSWSAEIERLERTGSETAATAAAGGAGVPREIEPPVDRETGREPAPRPAGEQAVSELAAALPAPHSFGRRGR